MGTVVSGRRGLRDRDRLHQTVQQLIAAGAIEAPAEMPRYLKAPPVPGVGAGWVWRPTKDGPWQMLGANAYLACAKLLQLNDGDVDVA